MIILTHLNKALFSVLSVGIMFALSGCSISNSMGSTSDSAGSMANSSESISDSSKSSSKSSEKDAKDSKYSRYENETLDFTVTYLRAGSSLSDQNGFMKGISDVASQNGIVDWEANPKTYRAIGKGLKMVNVSGTEFETYKKQFSSGDTAKMNGMQQGYGH